MKIKYHSKRVSEIVELVRLKEIDIENNHSEIMVAIKNKVSTIDLEFLIARRNSLIIDLNNLEKQAENVSNGKNQFGSEFIEYASKGLEFE